MRRRWRAGVRDRGRIDVGDRAGPLVRRAYEVYFRKNRHPMDRGEVLFSRQSAATGRWSVPVNDRFRGAVCDAYDCSGHWRVSSREEIVRPKPVPPYLRVMDASAWENDSKISRCLSAGMPIPVSLTTKCSVKAPSIPPSFMIRRHRSEEHTSE